MPDQTTMLDVQAAVFGQNEARRLAACLTSLCDSLAGRRAQISVILNGCTDDSPTIARTFAARAPVPIRVCRIAYADKSNAINQFYHELRVPARMYVGVDAYATVSTTAIAAMAACLARHPGANGVGTMAGNGRSSPAANAAVLREGGSIRGQLYALSSDFVERMVGAGIRLPIGLYRGDGLLGAFARHDLDGRRPSEPGRVPGEADATFYINPLRPWRLADLRRQYRRMVRQQRGRLENAAIRGIVHQHGFQALPDYADDMLATYLATEGVPSVGLKDQIFLHRALQGIATRRPDGGSLRAVCD